MDLFNLELTEAEKAELDRLRSQINIGRAVLHHRLESQLSQAELARLAETTQARVSDIEAMKGDPRLSTLGRIARALGCMIDMVPITPATQMSVQYVTMTYSEPPDVRHDATYQSGVTGSTYRLQPQP